MADAYGSEPYEATRGGSNPLSGTKYTIARSYFFH